jgi:hypothetical protein
MSPEQYDAWYETPRGVWIGGIESLRSGIALPGGGGLARRGEPLLGRLSPCCGAFTGVAADVVPQGG